MENKDDRLELELKNSFKKAFDKKELPREFYQNLEKELEKEKVLEKTLKRKIKCLLDKEIEIDLKTIGVAACILISLPTIYSIKEVGKEYKETVQMQKVLEKIEKNK